MARKDLDQKLDALRQAQQPRLIGKLIQENDESVLIQAGGAIFEIPTKHIVGKGAKRGEEVEFTLANDAEILLSTVVSVSKGFVADNVFGALVPDLLAENCNCNCSGGNCNCNCQGGGSGGGSIENFRSFRRPFTGGAKREFTT